MQDGPLNYNSSISTGLQCNAALTAVQPSSCAPGFSPAGQTSAFTISTGTYPGGQQRPAPRTSRQKPNSFGRADIQAQHPQQHPQQHPHQQQQQQSSSGRKGKLRAGNAVSGAGSQASAQRAAGSTAASAATPPAQHGLPATAGDGTVTILPQPWASMPLEEGLQLLWNSEQVQQATGGRLYNTIVRIAWQPVGELSAQDLYDFGKCKYVVHKLDVAHRTRLRLVVRMHAVADYGTCDLQSVYFEVRCTIEDLLEAIMQGMQGVRVLGLVRFALALQEALKLGPYK